MIELLYIYASSRDAAWKILGKNYSKLFKDNGREADGPCYFQEADKIPSKLITKIVNSNLGCIVYGHQTTYNGDVDMQDNQNYEGWCGYLSENIMLYVDKEF